MTICSFWGHKNVFDVNLYARLKDAESLVAQERYIFKKLRSGKSLEEIGSTLNLSPSEMRGKLQSTGKTLRGQASVRVKSLQRSMDGARGRTCCILALGAPTSSANPTVTPEGRIQGTSGSLAEILKGQRPLSRSGQRPPGLGGAQRVRAAPGVTPAARGIHPTPGKPNHHPIAPIPRAARGEFCPESKSFPGKRANQTSRIPRNPKPSASRKSTQGRPNRAALRAPSSIRYCI